MALRDRLSKAGVRVLTLDIETQAALVRTFGLFKQNIGINQVIEPSKVICLAYKWLDEKKAHFLRADDPDFAVKVRDLLSEADFVIHYNGTSFDIPHLNTVILLAGLTPPKPFKQIDLLRVVRKQFNFLSNKLDFVVQQLGLGAKVQHAGFDLWRRCADGDEKAWKEMERYNLGDIKVTEALFLFLLPWIPMSSHIGQFIGQEWCCPNCGCSELGEDGIAYANVTSYKLYQCSECGTWVRGTRKLESSPKTRQAR
jgi:DNA polymerase elongation subunit (family B)